MKKSPFILLFAIIVVHVKAQTLTNGGKLRPEQAIMDIRHYTIALNVNFEQKSIDGYTKIDVIMAQPTHVLLFNLLDSLGVSKVLVNNQPEPFEYKNNLITINLNKNLPAGKASVQVFYGGSRT